MREALVAELQLHDAHQVPDQIQGSVLIGIYAHVHSYILHWPLFITMMLLLLKIYIIS
jgi:hypothetical protein